MARELATVAIRFEIRRGLQLGDAADSPAASGQGTDTSREILGEVQNRGVGGGRVASRRVSVEPNGLGSGPQRPPDRDRPSYAGSVDGTWLQQDPAGQAST